MLMTTQHYRIGKLSERNTFCNMSSIHFTRTSFNAVLTCIPHLITLWQKCQWVQEGNHDNPTHESNVITRGHQIRDCNSACLTCGFHVNCIIMLIIYTFKWRSQPTKDVYFRKRRLLDPEIQSTKSTHDPNDTYQEGGNSFSLRS